MKAESLILSMARFPAVLSALVDGLGDEDWRRKPVSGNWSILEIVCHLLDEERDDFRQRLRLTLTEPETPWPAINPVAAAVERKYNQQDPRSVLGDFLRERQDSLAWLHGLGNTDWNSPYEHPQLGLFRAGDLLAAWAAHDLLHVRQITKRLFEATNEMGAPFQTRYAGDWS